MPTKRIEHVDRPFYMPRHVPDSSRLAALYTRMGETLARLSMARGENTARGLENFAGLFSNYRGEKRADAAAQAAAARRAIEREEDKAFARETADADRKARASERKEDADRSSARFAFSETAAGPISAATADLLRRFPETAGIVRDAETLPATVTPGAAGVVAPGPERFSVKEPTDDQTERSRARLAMEAARRDAMARATADDTRADRQLAEQSRHNAAMEAATRIRQIPDPKFFIRNGEVVPLLPNQIAKGDIPYSAEAMQGVGGESSDVRSSRTAAALNSIDVLKALAPKRVEGPVGMVQGAIESGKGALGYNTQVKQYNALLGPTAMQMAVAIQGAAGLSNSERETMKGMLGSIATMDYVSQMALLERASELIRGGADVALVTVKDPKTGAAVDRWVPRRSRPMGTVPVGATPGAAPGNGSPRVLSIVPVPKT